MTEYDYSPNAIERHMAKQAQIADWVDRTRQHEPENPFAPIPGEGPPSEAYYHPPPHPSQLYPQQYQYQQQQPYPAFYSTPQGVISPTYAGGSSKRHHHKHHHSSGSKSLRPSPHTSNAALPSMPMNLTYAPTPQRSVSTPPSMVMMGTGNAVHATMMGQQSYYGYQPMQQMAYPTYAPANQGYPFPQVTSQPVIAPSYSRSTSHSHSSRPSSSRKHRSRSHSRSTSYSYAPSQPMYGVQSPPLSNVPQIVQSPSNQPSYVPINGGGYVIIPPGQRAVIAPMGNYASSDQYYPRRYDSDSDSERGGGGSFFGNMSLKKLGTSLMGSKKSKRRGRRDSY